MHSQEHKERMKLRRHYQLLRKPTYRFLDKSRYKGSKKPTDWLAMRLEAVAEAFREFGKQ